MNSRKVEFLKNRNYFWYGIGKNFEKFKVSNQYVQSSRQALTSYLTVLNDYKLIHPTFLYPLYDKEDIKNNNRIQLPYKVKSNHRYIFKSINELRSRAYRKSTRLYEVHAAPNNEKINRYLEQNTSLYCKYDTPYIYDTTYYNDWAFVDCIEPSNKWYRLPPALLVYMWIWYLESSITNENINENSNQYYLHPNEKQNLFNWLLKISKLYMESEHNLLSSLS